MAPNTLSAEQPVSPESSSDLSEETLAGRRLANAPPGEEICITGISGKFPESENVHELRDNLFRKANLITSDDRRWNRNKSHPDLPKFSGKIEGLPKFDASFFGFHVGQADGCDLMTRMFLEKSYEAIVDAGVNPLELRGKRMGVFVGVCFSESEPFVYLDTNPVIGRSILSSARISHAQRIAYWLQVNGPCYSLDSACSSSLYALDHAYKAIRDGACDQAIVAGAGLVMNPNLSLQFFRLGVLCEDGRCKTFDQDADGYGRSEALSAIFLQKTRDARRIYATVVYSKTNNDGFKPQGITFPSSLMQTQLLSDFYRECDVDPTSLAWVEAHGTGTKVGDPEECIALDTVFCTGRDKPLPVGSVKSNLGHTEPASGLCSIAKVIIAMENEVIPPNINFKKPKAGVPGLVDGRLQVITTAQPWDGGLVGVNSFGFGGANAHVCLRSNDKAKLDGGAPSDKLTRLVVLSGRTERSVSGMIDDLCSRPVDAELVFLYHGLAAIETPGHVFRGYALLKPGQPIKHVQSFDKQPRPVWLSFPALESTRWPGMGSALTALPPFTNALAECQAALDACQLPSPISLREIMAAGKLEDLTLRILASAALQIGLGSVLRAVGVVPVVVMGSGSGELAAGYAVGCLTAGQAMRAALALGVVRGQGVLGGEGRLTEMLGQVLPTPVAGSSRWLSAKSSVSAASLSSALLTHAAAHKVMRLAPKNGVVLHATGDRTDVVERQTAMSISLMKRGADDLDHLLLSLGKLYVAGGNSGEGILLAELYPTVALPVSRGTPMIAPHVDWEHSRNWHTEYYHQNSVLKTQETTCVINVEKDRFKFYKGHVIDGRNLFPATGYLYLTWEHMLAHSATDCNVVFENVRFHRATTIPPTGNLELTVSIQKSSGKFEVVEGGSKVVTGRVYFDAETDELEVRPPERAPAAKDEYIEMGAKDIYKELRLRGYNYSGLFKGLVSADFAGDRGKIRWADDNWVAFMDNMLQIHILHADTRGLFVPTSIARLTIDASKHLRLVAEKIDIDGDEDPVLDIEVVKEVKLIRSGGIEIRGLAASAISMKKVNAEPVLESYRFLPYKIEANDQEQLPLELALRACVHVGLENRGIGAGIGVKVAELVDAELVGEPLAPTFAKLLADLPLLQADIVLLSTADPSTMEDSLGPRIRLEAEPLAKQESCTFVTASRVLRRPDVLQDALGALSADGFLLARELPETQPESDSNLHVLCEYLVGDEKFMLLRKSCPPPTVSVVRVREENGEWIGQAQEALRDCKKGGRVVLFAQDEPLSGLLGAFNCLNKEHSGIHARCVLILDESAPQFDVELPLYRDQLSLDLAINVYSDGRWGSFRHLPLESNAVVEVGHAYANTLMRGDLSSFRWLEGSLDYPGTRLPPDYQLVHVYYASLNFRDVMIASGKLNVDVVSKERLANDCFQGIEFSGRTADGRRVMGMSMGGSQSSIVAADNELLWDVPEKWTLEEAATVPVVYGTVLYAIRVKCALRRGESILIHSGTGGVGQAAINVALHEGLTVFTTVGTPEKRVLIKKLFPTLTDRQIGNSRDTSFEQLVMRETDGRGVDLVLNSLAEEKLQASLRCLARGGRFLEIGKFDLASNNEIGMELFLKEVSFHGVTLDSVFESKSKLKVPIQNLILDGIRDGYIRPLAREVFPGEEVEQAYRFMGAGKHTGKVLLKIRDEEVERTIAPAPLLVRAVPRFCCQPLGTYIVAGGLGGFGLELADWLVLRGALQMVLVSRSGLRTGYQSSRVRAWRSYGVDVRVSTADIQTEEGVVELLTMANEMGPVAGIFNLAVVLQDALFENQTPERFSTAAGPKALATRLLDSASRRLCPHLQNFVVFSSVSCGRGNAGQTSYGAANSVMERVCERRARDGLPALAVQWGAVGQVGLVADMRDDDKEIIIGGTLPQRIGSCLAALDGFLRQKQPVVASMVVAEKLAGGPADSMLNRVAGILGISDLKKVSFQTTLAELGMDSMTAVEIKQTLEREYQVFLTPVEIRGLTFARVVELSANEDRTTEGVMEANPLGIAQFAQGLGNEHSAYAATLVLPSRLTPSTPTPDDVQTLLMVPGLEGVASALEPLARNIDAHAVCLQGDWATDLSETAHEIAQMLLPHAVRELGGSPNFRLLGYSFGGLVTLHLATLLEAEGRQGQVFVVDGAPDYLQQLLKMVAVDGENDSNDALEANLLVAIVNLILKQVGGTSEKIREAIISLPSWTERLEFAMTLVPTDMFSNQYLRDAGNSAMRRLKAVNTFEWPEGVQIQSPVTLLRPAYKNLKLPLDLGVNKYCKLPVDVHLFDETHVSILESLQMATIINNQLVQSVDAEKRR